MSASARRIIETRRGAGTRLVAALLLACIAATQVRAEAVTPEFVQQLIDEHGAEVLVKVMMKARHGQMTISRNGRLQDVWGRPRLDLVTAQSLSTDASKAKLDQAGLLERLSRHVTLKNETDRRLSGGGAVQAVIPLANLDPDLRVRAPARSWRVKELIEDAERHHKHLSADLNTVRKREA
jgi:hypothetical protein